MPWPRPTGSGSRTVEVASPSVSGEAAWVFMAVGYIVLCMIYVYGFQHEAGQATNAQDAARTLLPYQVLFRDLPSADQRIFRAMQEGSLEAVRIRGESGRWPTAGELAASDVPPFAPDVLDKSGYRWDDRRQGLVVNYVGVPSATRGGSAYLILAQEPDPVTGERPPPPSVVDEEHQLLPGGVLLHVTYWKRAGADFDGGAIVDPPLQGWQQIRVKTLFEELERR